MPWNRIIPFSLCLMAITSLFGCSECSGRRCYLTSCSNNKGLKWSLPKQHATECSEITFGGHLSQCPSGGTDVLLDTPFVQSGLEDVQNVLTTERLNVTSQTTSTQKSMSTAAESLFNTSPVTTNGEDAYYNLSTSGSHPPIFTTITEESVSTIVGSCDTEDTWVNENCSMRCNCTEKQWLCNTTSKCSLKGICMVSGGTGECTYKPGYITDNKTCKPFYKDCQEAFDDGHRNDGIYTILPANWSSAPFNVSCDMTTDGGGWTIFQRRIDGVTDFYRNWCSYKVGFGSLNESRDFWLGNEKLFYITNQGKYKLRVEITTSSGEAIYKEYQTFRIGNEESHYNLEEIEVMDGFSGTRRDGLTESKGHPFSTHDKDNDNCEYFNCAEGHHGAWWYTNRWCKQCLNNKSYCDDFVIHATCHNVCAGSNLNGGYSTEPGKNINWKFASNCFVKSTEMKIKPN